MASQVDEITSFSRRLREDSARLNRPMMLKDFLRDDSSVSCTSSSSNGFPMYTRGKPCKSTTVVPSKSNKPPSVMLRSWSKKAAANKISAIVKLLQLASLRSPSVLPRTFSRKLTKRNKHQNDLFGDVSEVKVKVKDILRWRSFRDMVEESSTPSDFSSSPDRSTMPTTTTTMSSCSKRSSWCDSDFTAGESSPWSGETEEIWGKNSTTLRNSKAGDNWLFEESEQKSPVSVLDSPFREVEDFIISPFHPTLAINYQKAECNLSRRIQEQSFKGETVVSEGSANAAEEKAKQLLMNVKEGNDQLILDFFMHELSINGKFQDEEFDCKILRIAKSWINGDGQFDESYEWELENRRESYVKDLEEGTCWNNVFKQEQEELSEELEFEVLDDLIQDLFTEFLAK